MAFPPALAWLTVTIRRTRADIGRCDATLESFPRRAGTAAAAGDAERAPGHRLVPTSPPTTAAWALHTAWEVMAS